MHSVPTLRLGFALLVAAIHCAALTVEPTAKIEGPLTAVQRDFFEKSIRPVLSEKCYKCHSAEAEKVKGGLLLDTRDGIRMGGDSGHAVVPGNVKESLLIAALKWEDKDTRMPPEKSGGKLAESVIADFEKWVKMGAPDPRDGTSVKPAKKEWDLVKGKEFWAFQAPKAVAPPAVRDTVWPRTVVDKFILAAQEGRQLKPVADADPRTLIRRIYFDLIGLPPTPAEVNAFVAAADRQKAVAAVVDKLLASLQFGERWGRHWLDVARYGESTGKERNVTFGEAWRYRDYIIASVNADKPYDQFIREQIAGDLLPAKDDKDRSDKLVATGFLALGPKSLNEKNREIFRMDLIDEQIDTTTRAVLGITVACARCHDHKFDPIPQREYYSLAGIFRSSETHYGTAGAIAGKNRNPSTLVPLGPPVEPKASVEAPKPVAVPAISDKSQAAGRMEERLKMLVASDPKKAQKLANLSPSQRAALLERLASSGSSLGKSGKRGYGTPAAQPLLGPACMALSEGHPGNARVLARGEVDAPGENVPRGFITVLTNGAAPAIPESASGRLELAQWLTDAANPLTARVAVNRIWQHLFGQGLVRTADNFGATGEKPSHPELLDALATQFMREGWSVKQLVRSLVLSRTYQLSSAYDSFANEADPDNQLLWRSSVRRLEAEAIHDAILAASGKLDLTPLPRSLVATHGDGYIGKGLRPEIFTEYESTHRGIYFPVVRDFVPQALELFDFAEPSLVVAARDVTNVPAQALFLLNNSFVREQAAAMAARVLATPLDYPGRIQLTYQLALGRPPTEAERQRADHYLLDEARGLIQAKSNAKDTAAQLSWSTFCQALFACAEFRYVR